MLRKGNKVGWSPAGQQAFDTLKKALASSTILALPRDEGEFVLDVDSSKAGAGPFFTRSKMANWLL